MSSKTEQVCTSILTDFINEHDVIGYDIISELNRFDQFIKGQKPSHLLHANKKEQCLLGEKRIAEKLVAEYAELNLNEQQERTKYKCKLCSEQQFNEVEKFLDHIEIKHLSQELKDEREKLMDEQCTGLWVGELENIKKNNYHKHSEEFLKEIDKIISNDEASSTVSNTCELSSSNCSLPPPIDTENTTAMPSSSKPPKKKKKRTAGQCEVCLRTFNDRYNLRIHKMIHTGEKPYQCDECGKRFRQYNKLKIHCITHTNDKPYVCDICGKGFRFRNYLSVHKRLHSGEKPYKCKFCELHFHSLHSRQSHTKLMHLGDTESFACPICKKVLAAQCYLTSHMKRHANQRDYNCNVCEKSFFTLSQLKDHQMVHSNLKPYQCDECEARFQRKSNYTQHLKIHTGKKAYVCSICNKSFAQNAGLYGHMKTHTKSLDVTA